MPTELNIVILSGVQGDTRRYRCFHLSEQFRLVNIPCTLDHITSKTAAINAAQATILILQRVTWDRNIARIVDEVRSRHTIILADLDDLVFLPDSFQWIDSPDFADPVRVRLYQENLQRNRLTIENCDGIIVSTGFLAEQVQSFAKPVWVHRNAFSLEMFASAQKVLRSQKAYSDQVIIGYASGTPTHDQDFMLVQPVLKKLLEEYPHLYLHLVGHLNKNLDWGRVSSQVHYINYVPWRKLSTLLSHFSINIAPLRLDNPFSQSKSEIKYVEAALVKVPTVASPTEAFQYAIRHGENGFLANSPAEWEVYLRELIENSQLRSVMGEKAYHDVLKSHSPWVRAEEAVQLLNLVMQTLKSDLQPLPELKISPISNPHAYRHLWTKEENEEHPTLLERSIYSIKNRGFTTLLQEIWIYLRRLLSPIFPFRKVLSDASEKFTTNK